MAGEWKNNDVLQYVSLGFQVFSIKNWLEYAEIGWSDYLIAFYIMIVLVFLVIIDFIYASFAVNNQKHSLSFTGPISILQYTCFILITVLFQPALGNFTILANFLYRTLIKCVIMQIYESSRFATGIP